MIIIQEIINELGYLPAEFLECLWMSTLFKLLPLQLLQKNGLFCRTQLTVPICHHRTLIPVWPAQVPEGSKFDDNESVNAALEAWVSQCSPEFFLDKIKNWGTRWKKCVMR
jgi:hypothetical protein